MEPPGRPRGRALLLLPLALLAVLGEGGGGGGAAALPPGCKHDGRPRGAGKAAGAAEGKVVCSSLELAQVLPPDTLPNRTVTL
jgi:G protein-coupled receptor 125